MVSLACLDPPVGDSGRRPSDTNNRRLLKYYLTEKDIEWRSADSETSGWSGKTVQRFGVVRFVTEVDQDIGCDLLLKGDLCEHESDTNRMVACGD